MSNYMLYLIDHEEFKPKYYCPHDPVNPIYILPNQVCRLYGVKIANIFCGNRSIDQMYITTGYFDPVDPVKESVPPDALKDLSWCMHFSDDWDDDVCDSFLHTKEGLKDATARHQKKYEPQPQDENRQA